MPPIKKKAPTILTVKKAKTTGRPKSIKTTRPPINIAKILDWFRLKTRNEKMEIYKKMYPALLAKREVFYRYVQKQWKTIDNLTF